MTMMIKDHGCHSMSSSLLIYLTGLVTQLRVTCGEGLHFLSQVMLLTLSSSGWSILSTRLCILWATGTLVGRSVSRIGLIHILDFSQLCLHMFQVQSRVEGPKFRSQLQSFMLCTPSDQHLTKGVLILLIPSTFCQGMSLPSGLCSRHSVELMASMHWTCGVKSVFNLLRTFSNGIGHHICSTTFDFP